MSEGAQPIFARGKSLLEQLLRMAQNRLELLSLELEQEKLRVARDLRLAAFAAIFAWLAFFTLVLLAALALPPGARLPALGALFVLFLIASLVSFLLLRRSMRRDPLFSRVITQLRLDRASLSQEP
ncbi:MAG TPA: phage holin family protein [Steroidobacteraceae bacterium]|nr:phage holin family protein [Steroidobacteraceae bacterium]